MPTSDERMPAVYVGCVLWLIIIIIGCLIMFSFGLAVVDVIEMIKEGVSWQY